MAEIQKPSEDGKLGLLSLEEAGLQELSNRFSSGELNLFEYYEWLERYIEKREPTVRALLPEKDRKGRLEREIKALYDRYPEADMRPPLFGIPFGIKDIFHADGFETQAGSKLPPEELASQEAESVSHLKDAGALVYAKTVTTEFAYLAPGPTRNPHNPAHTPGGSSSGSAAAVGAGMVPVALGTQTIGSIIRPAAFCGAVGFKPTYERISRDGVIPLSVSVDHIGFFTRNSEDAEVVASILVENWKPLTLPAKPRLGIPEGPYLENASEEGLEHFEELQSRLSKVGFDLVPIYVMANFEEIRERHNRIVAAEAAWTHRDWFRQYEDLYHPKTAELIRSGMKTSTQELQAALLGREELRSEVETAAEGAGINLWISPSAPGAAPSGLESTGDPVMNLPWTHSGLPSVSLPSGYNREGLPFGLQIVGSWYRDEEMLAWAKMLEKELRVE
jgi:Asp-tRNA(Asn)/Glu-tRNA(Gln) amidotransferase A subunit family amidase